MSENWQAFAQTFNADPSQPESVLALLDEAYALEPPAPRIYHAALNPRAVAEVRSARMEREKMLLRVKLAKLARLVRTALDRATLRLSSSVN